MTVPVIKVKVFQRAVIKAKADIRYPAKIEGGVGTDVITANGTATVNLNYNELNTVSSVQDAQEATTYLALWESINNVWSKISTENFATEVGFPASTTDNAVARYDGTTGALQNSGVLIDDSNNVVPAADDGGALGTTALKWSDAFYASGAVLNFNSGDVTITHAANSLAFAGASSGYSFDAAALPSANDAAALGSVTVSWADLFLAAGGVLNWNNGDVTVTHSANALAFAGASSGYTFDAVVTPAASDGAALGTSGVMWSDLFLASGGVINFNAGNITVTHSAGNLTLAGGTLTLPNAGLVVGASTPFSDSAGTLTLQNVDALDGTTESTIETAIDTLANLTSIQGRTVTLADAGLDVLFGWDDSGSAYKNFALADLTDEGTPTTGDYVVIYGAEGDLRKTNWNLLPGAGSTFPSGTLMLFQQTAAPTGWTKQTTHNDKALRVVSGAASSGGTSAFSTVFGLTATSGTTLTNAHLPASISGTAGTGAATSGGSFTALTSGGSGGGAMNNTGGGTAHTHPIELRVQYVDLIIASKD